LIDENGVSVGQVIVRLAKPEKIPGEDDFSCGYQILGLGTEAVRTAVGVDAVQALFLAMTKIGADLYTSAEASTCKLSWHGDKNLGFPVFVVLGSFVPGHKEQVVI